MSLEVRVERFQESHIDPYIRLSRSEYGDHAPVSQANHLRWKFLENPQGATTGIHLYRNGELVGRMAALSRQFCYRGKTFTAAHIVDFLVLQQERGMASLMQLISGLKQLSGFDFLFITAPNPAGATVWEKFVKLRGVFDLDVAVEPLRPAALLASKGKRIAGALEPAVDLPWRSLVGALTWLGSCTSQVVIETAWPDAKELDHMTASNGGECATGLRSAAFLEWRYRRSPVFQYKVFFLREKGLLSGYFVARRTVYDNIDCLFIVDAFGQPQLHSGSWRAALRAALSEASGEAPKMVMFMGNMKHGALSAASGIPFVKVPPRFLPRKPTIYAQWLTSPGFDFTRDSLYVALGDCDMV